MFRNFYQGGPYLEIFSTQNKALLSKWKLPARGRKEFDDEVRTYVYCLNGSTSTSKIELRKESRKGSGLVQPYVVFQVKIPYGAEFCIEISVACYSQNRRIFLSTSQKTKQITTLLAMIPLASELKGKWNNLSINVHDLVTGFWKEETFHCLESISVGGTFRLKRIFTMKFFPRNTGDQANFNKLLFNAIPKSLQLPHFLPQLVPMISTESIGYDPSEKKTPKHEDKPILAGRYSAESLPCSRVASDVEMKFSTVHSRSLSCEFYSVESSSPLSSDSSRQSVYNRMPFLGKNKVSPIKYPKTARLSFSGKKSLRKKNLDDEPCTLVSKFGRPTPVSISPNKDSTEDASSPEQPVGECPDYGQLVVTGQKIKSPCHTEEAKYEVGEEAKSLDHLNSSPSSPNNCHENLRIRTAKSYEGIQLDRQIIQDEHTTGTKNYRSLYSLGDGSSADVVSRWVCEIPDQDYADAQLACEDVSQSYFGNFPSLTHSDSPQTQVSVYGRNVAEQLSETLGKLTTDEVQECNTLAVKVTCGDVVHGDSAEVTYLCDLQLRPVNPSSYNDKNERVNKRKRYSMKRMINDIDSAVSRPGKTGCVSDASKDSTNYGGSEAGP